MRPFNWFIPAIADQQLCHCSACLISPSSLGPHSQHEQSEQLGLNSVVGQGALGRVQQLRTSTEAVK